MRSGYHLIGPDSGFLLSCQGILMSWPSNLAQEELWHVRWKHVVVVSRKSSGDDAYTSNIKQQQLYGKNGEEILRISICQRKVRPSRIDFHFSRYCYYQQKQHKTFC